MISYIISSFHTHFFVIHYILFHLSYHHIIISHTCFLYHGSYNHLIYHVIRWRSISMRAGLAFLQFDWLKAGLSMDLPVFIYSHTKTSFRFLSRQRKYREAFYVVTDLLLQATQREPYRALVLSRLRLSRSTDHQDRNLIHYLIVSSPYAVRPTTLSFV